jgi:hypothetical protein
MSTAVVLAALKSELATRYRTIAELHPAEAKFLVKLCLMSDMKISAEELKGYQGHTLGTWR